MGVRDRMHKTGFSLSIVPSIDQSIVACERACVCACVLQQIHSSLPDLSLWTLTSVIFESVRGKGRKEEESESVIVLIRLSKTVTWPPTRGVFYTKRNARCATSKKGGKEGKDVR